MNTSLRKTVVCCVRVDKGAAMLGVNMDQITVSSTTCCKFSARWVRRQVTPKVKGRCMDACQELLRQCEIEGEGILKHMT
jgi:hypothetical protein